ncbi:DUF4291 domain-containing protein [Viridibacterium curvum]|uniref:DUF4291 domain-containing protein n=1 Tax=Viridibacterium curvum TaxID=1101404 RepID=A0ABP9QH45_9RHOO
MNLETENYKTQTARWPEEGQHILAQYDTDSIIVYQAYRPSIGQFAIANGYLGGPDFSLSRMSWIKPNFLWMMYRAGWGTKEGQEMILGLRIRRTFFDSLLDAAVASSFEASGMADRAAWQEAVQASDVRLQWDPDHSPSGDKLSRRAVQLGLRGDTLKAFAQSELLEVIDMSDLVSTQRQHVHDWHTLMTPREDVYVPASQSGQVGSQ